MMTARMRARCGLAALAYAFMATLSIVTGGLDPYGLTLAAIFGASASVCCVAFLSGGQR